MLDETSSLSVPPHYTVMVIALGEVSLHPLVVPHCGQQCGRGKLLVMRPIVCQKYHACPCLGQADIADAGAMLVRRNRSPPRRRALLLPVTA